NHGANRAITARSGICAGVIVDRHASRRDTMATARVDGVGTVGRRSAMIRRSRIIASLASYNRPVVGLRQTNDVQLVLTVGPWSANDRRGGGSPPIQHSLLLR